MDLLAGREELRYTLIRVFASLDTNSLLLQPSTTRVWPWFVTSSKLYSTDAAPVAKGFHSPPAVGLTAVLFLFEIPTPCALCSSIVFSFRSCEAYCLQMRFKAPISRCPRNHHAISPFVRRTTYLIPDLDVLLQAVLWHPKDFLLYPSMLRLTQARASAYSYSAGPRSPLISRINHSQV